MVQRTYYPLPEKPTTLPPAPKAVAEPEFTSLRAMHIRHGYTLDDLDRLTRMALGADRLMAMSFDERRDIAWSAIAEALCAAEEPPHYQELVRVGWQAIYRHVRDGLRQRGYADGDRDWSSDDPTKPRFVAYWGSRVEPSHEDRIVEKIAADQVLATLGTPYRDAFVALAIHENYMKAADALDINYKALIARIGTARKVFLARWHEGETPYRPRRVDRRVESNSKELATHCGNGHEWTPENTRWATNLVRGKPKHRRFCRACEQDRGKRRSASQMEGAA